MLDEKAASGVPLYFQLRTILREKILSGEYASEEQIPPETELCREYGVSRITVRKAIDSLVQEKLLFTQQGKGTFVTTPKLRRQLPRLYSFSEDIQEFGLTPSSTVVDFFVEDVFGEDEKLLRLPDHDKEVFRISRVRKANGIPILLETTLIPHVLCDGLLSVDLERNSLYQTLRDDYGLSLHDAEETYEVGLVTSREGALLEIGRGQPVFKIQRIANLADGTPFELTRSVARGDIMQFSLHLTANEGEQFKRRIDLDG